MRHLALIFVLFRLVGARTNGPNERFAGQRASSAWRGGSMRQKEHIASTVQRILSLETLSYVTRPTTIVKATLQFLQGQSDAAQERRSQFSHNPLHIIHNDDVDDIRTSSIFHPFRILKLTAFAFLLVEITDCVLANDNFRSLYKENIEPLVQEGWQRASQWWSKGRQEGGLFCPTTWSWKNINGAPQSIIKAWNEQFSRKVQRGFGVTLGLILSPIIWTLTAQTLGFVSIVVIISEINLYVGEKIEIALRRVSLRLSHWWGRVDVALETIRRTFRALVHKSIQVKQAALEKNFNATVPEEVLPISLQQGLAIGLLMGCLAGV